MNKPTVICEECDRTGTDGFVWYQGEIMLCSDEAECKRRQSEKRTISSEAVDHPKHYGGEDDPYEVIKVAEAWGFDHDAYLFNVLKYIARASKKGATLEDHKKARFYIDRKIQRLEQRQ